MNEGTRLIRVSKDLLDFMGTRAENGDRLSFEWGEPIENIVTFGEPVYTPTVHADRNDNLLGAERLAKAIEDVCEAHTLTISDPRNGMDFSRSQFASYLADVLGALAGEGGTDG